MNSAAKVDYRVLFENSPGLNVVLDPHFFIIAASNQFLQATMTCRQDIVGQNFFDVFPDNPDDPKASGVRNLRSSLERVLRDRVADSMAVQQHDIRRPDGQFEERYWSPVNSPVFGSDGHIEYIIHCVDDVTEFVRLRQSREESKRTETQHARVATMETEIFSRSRELGVANEQLKLANEELEMRTAELNDTLQTMQTFTYSIAHDLRGPLRALVNFSTLLESEYDGKIEEPGRDWLHRIKSAAERMDRLVSDLLAYGQLTHVEVTVVPISLESAVTKAMQDLSSEIRIRNAMFDVERPLPTVIGNIVLLNQVLLNLIGNAIKFVPPDKIPRIKIDASVVENRVRLCIRDNGIGIAPVYHDRIFDLFARLHKATEYSGTGIGLALVKKAMERMMGKVGVESVPGEGSCFWLEFRSSR
jgi:signal transduction histidine kinase